MKAELGPNSFSLVAVLSLAAVIGSVYFIHSAQQARQRERAEARIAAWLPGPKLMAEALMERYGPPDNLSPQTASWYGRSPWKRIAVYGDSSESYLEQTVAYRPQIQSVKLIRAFGHGVSVDTVNDELSARGDRESLNCLALNVADEVATGARDVGQARKFYSKTAQLAASGKSSPYLRGLKFEPYVTLPQALTSRDFAF